MTTKKVKKIPTKIKKLDNEDDLMAMVITISKKAHNELKIIAKEVRIQNKIPMTQSNTDIIQGIISQLVTQYVRQNMQL